MVMTTPVQRGMPRMAGTGRSPTRRCGVWWGGLRFGGGRRGGSRSGGPRILWARRRRPAASVGGKRPRVDGPAVLDRDALELAVVVEGLDALLPAVAALLVPAERRLHGAGGPRVDEDLPGLDGVGHAQGAGDVA